MLKSMSPCYNSFRLYLRSILYRMVKQRLFQLLQYILQHKQRGASIKTTSPTRVGFRYAKTRMENTPHGFI